MNNIIYKVMFIVMINEYNVKKYCCEDIRLIENYELAVNDETQTWACHHRLEIQDGKSVYVKELKENNLYFHRPASELIFLTNFEHKKLHNKGSLNPHFNKHHSLSDESKLKISLTHKEKPKSEEHKQKLRQPRSEESKHKISAALSRRKGLHYYNNGVKTVLRKTCPSGFIPGRLYHKSNLS